jgi:hypothetical protein
MFPGLLMDARVLIPPGIQLLPGYPGVTVSTEFLQEPEQLQVRPADLPHGFPVQAIPKVRRWLSKARELAIRSESREPGEKPYPTSGDQTMSSRMVL